MGKREAIDTRRLGVCKKSAHNDGRGRSHAIIGEHSPRSFDRYDLQKRPTDRISGHVGELQLTPMIVHPLFDLLPNDFEQVVVDYLTSGDPVSVGELPISEDDGRLVDHVRRQGSYVATPWTMSSRVLAI